ncbi:hypothetical protein A2V68_02760 [candidate division Kazan bacterium RBG_13_50_9]|uniref:DNA ligase (ATP) n=1 Tax=candidate division Kazan bacterium RBG_13_50_9 TaxID=1798535 RepID=A0A1F4NT26_UNCK3|nr:MAG: hypothetical protein A2V68_02760 [candidate division Kazan bacterium RBG_13_50_9]
MKSKFISPMLCKLIKEPFDDKGWAFERKLDGVRLIAVKRGNTVQLWTRNRKNRARQFPEIVVAIKKQRGDFVIDGEAVVYNKKGISSFQMIQPRVQQTGEDEIKMLSCKSQAVYEAFDLLVLNGKDLKSQSWSKRKEQLKGLIKGDRALKYLPHVSGSGKKLFLRAKKAGWEGIIGKKKNSWYLPGKRGHGWGKIKTVFEQELVIGGWTRGYGKAAGSFGALLVGYYRKNDLIFAGEVGTGYTEDERRRLKAKLIKLEAVCSPFKDPPKGGGIAWVKPILVGQFKFAEWTRDDILRMPVYLGLRTDKPAREVVKEG